jgi:hypothetical protein
MRWGDATAMSFNLPALTSCNDTPRLSNMQSTLPATRSLSAGAHVIPGVRGVYDRHEYHAEKA